MKPRSTAIFVSGCRAFGQIKMLVAIGVDNAGIWRSFLPPACHCSRSAAGGMLEDRPALSTHEHVQSFPVSARQSQPRLAELGERLDAFRKERLAAHDFLTMTGLYNALERLRELDAGIGAPLTDAERDVYDAGQIAILKELHDEIDREVFAAYGWSDLGDRLVGKPGGTTPSPHKSEDQQAAEEELLVRLVALNQAARRGGESGHCPLAAPRFPDARASPPR